MTTVTTMNGAIGTGRGRRVAFAALLAAGWLAACGDDSSSPDDASASGSGGAGATSTASSVASVASVSSAATTSAVSSTAATSTAATGGGGGAGGGEGGQGGAGPDLGPLALVPVEGSLSLPIYGAAAPDAPGEILVAEKRGRIRRVVDGVLEPTPFLDISDQIEPPGAGAEEGLLSFALSPDYDATGLFYVLVADKTTDDIVVTELARSVDDPTLADPASAREVMRFPIVPGNHIAGATAFGPDGYLYIAMGDQTSAQDLSVKFGKVLRIDVETYPEPVPGNMEGDDVDPDIFYAGFHNPWRITFDRETGELFIGDVGLMPPFEEVNRRSIDDGPADFGYPSMSGFECVDEPCDDYVAPILAYPHDDDRCAIMGGYVYRGAAIPALVGRYVFADLCTGELFSMAADREAPAPLQPITPTYLPLDQVPVNPIGFIEDGDGELWVIGVGGPVAKLVPAE